MAKSRPLRGRHVLPAIVVPIPETSMQVEQDRPDLVTLATAIANSPIVVASPAACVRVLPPGFDAVDADILEWIAQECRRTRLGYWLM
jgi:hypothetical protein